MQQRKNIKSFSEITNYCKNSSILLNTFSHLLNEINLNYIHALFNKTKSQGIEGKHIFKTLFVLRFLDFNNIHQVMQSGVSKEFAHKKDVLYDFLNNAKIDWRRITWLFAKQIFNIIRTKTIDENDQNLPKCLIVDDSILPKSGKKMELIGKVFDHGKHTYTLGMKLLTLGYSDCKSFIPLNFSLHNEAGKSGNRGLKPKELKNQFKKDRDKNTPGYQRSLEVPKDKISVALKMIKSAIRKLDKVDYVLADSWFICEKFIAEIKNFNKQVNVIGLMKINRMVTIENKNYKASNIPDIKRKNIKYSNKLKCHYITQKIGYKNIGMRAYWIKIKGQNTWCLLISTNEKLTFIKAMEYYQIRWGIEVFFKDCKQNLKLGDCQSKDLDAHIASISIVFMNYMVLALKKRFENYETMGILFRNFKDMMLQRTLIQRIWTIIIELFDSVLIQFGVNWENFMQSLIQNQDQIMEQFYKTFENLFSLNSTKVT